MSKYEESKDRLMDIQNKLTDFIQEELQQEDDHLYLATMLMKHSLILYSVEMDEDGVRALLQHCMDNLNEDYFKEKDLLIAESNTTLH